MSQQPLFGAAAWQDADEPYRYELGRRWSDDGPLAVWVMLNPSTATDLELDPTLRRVRDFSRREGCAGFVVLNLFAYRTPKPAEMVAAAPQGIVGPRNDTRIEAVLGEAQREGWPVIFGWGAHPFAEERGRIVLAMATELGVQPHCLGVTKSGAPRHPLYLKKTAALRPWDAPCGR